jgi:ADP-heptose:LPS heptosyltransferase
MNHPDIDGIISVQKASLDSFIGTIKCGFNLRKIKLDYFFTLTDSFRSALVLWVSGSLKTIGYKSQMRSFLLTESRSKSRSIIHRSKKYLALLSAYEKLTLKQYLHISPSEKKWGLKEIKKMGMDKPIGLFPFSVSNKRTISKSTIIKWIQNSQGDYLVFGSRNDIQKGKNLIDSCEELSIKSICGKYTLRQSIILISLCKYALAADSGLGHISAALGVPTISFFGVGSPSVTGPIGKKVKIFKHCFPCGRDFCENSNKEVFCLNKISKQDIEHAVKKLTMK